MDCSREDFFLLKTGDDAGTQRVQNEESISPHSQPAFACLELKIVWEV